MSDSTSASSGPSGRSGCKITLEQLRAELKADRTPVQIARDYGMTPAGVRKRIQEVKTLDAAAALAPTNNRRFAEQQINAVEEILRCREWMVKLGEACERYLADPDSPDQFDLRPRAEEVKVIYWRTDPDGKIAGKKPEKKSLQYLIDLVLSDPDTQLVAVESKHGDPRLMLPNIVDRVMLILTQCDRMMRLVADVREMQRLKEMVLDAMEKADPPTRKRMQEELDRGFATFELFRGASGLLT